MKREAPPHNVSRELLTGRYFRIAEDRISDKPLRAQRMPLFSRAYPGFIARLLQYFCEPSSTEPRPPAVNSMTGLAAF
jgi:hypothetical protein